MIVTNINGTSDNSCSCGSWLRHWLKFNTGRQSIPTICPACKNNRVEVGAHVQKSESTDKSWYIVPLCKACNGKSADTKLDIGKCSLASANKSLTCE